jgi:uncharacterized coiled-coil DUF342 family protein
MYKEMATFKKKAEAIEKQIAELQAKKLETQQELAAVTREHDDEIMKEALQGITADERKLERLKKKIRELNEKIADYDHRIAVIESKRREVLAELFEDLEKGYRREIEALKREASAQFNDAIKIGFEYLLALQRVGKLKEKAAALHQEFLREGLKAVEFDYFESKYRYGHDWIDTTLFRPYENIFFGVTEKAQREALNGYISPSVMLYELTGEIEGHLNRADTKLRQLKSK